MKVTEIYAYISVDQNSDEGIIAARNPKDGSWNPMIATDMARMEALKPLVKRIAANSNMKIKLVKFTLQEEIETIETAEIPVK